MDGRPAQQGLAHPAPFDVSDSRSLLKISALATEFVKVETTATKNDVAYDPTADAVALAFVAVAGTPVAGDWKTGSWETISGRYHARALVGPSGGVITLAVGRYSVWVRVTNNPETPIIRAGELEVY